MVKQDTIASLGVTRATWQALQESPLGRFDEYTEMIDAIRSFADRVVPQMYDREGRPQRTGSREHHLYSKLVKMVYEVTLGAGDETKQRKDLQRVHLWYCFQLNALPRSHHGRAQGFSATVAAPNPRNTPPEKKLHGDGDEPVRSGTNFAVKFLSASLDKPSGNGSSSSLADATSVTVHVEPSKVPHPADNGAASRVRSPRSVDVAAQGVLESLGAQRQQWNQSRRARTRSAPAMALHQAPVHTEYRLLHQTSSGGRGRPYGHGGPGLTVASLLESLSPAVAYEVNTTAPSLPPPDPLLPRVVALDTHVAVSLWSNGDAMPWSPSACVALHPLRAGIASAGVPFPAGAPGGATPQGCR